MDDQHKKGEQKSSIKETLTSITIAFALAFVFRGFVVEAFLIPTGSMAPTLMGQHIRLASPASGYEWPVGPALGPQADNSDLQDPMTGYPMRISRQDRSASGDRIFVLKYLYSIYDPARFDVVVFKNPRDPDVNYIKRLVGLPGEQIALIDGDVFFRKPQSSDPEGVGSWALPGWQCARKPERAQRAMWQPLFDSRYAPLTDSLNGARFFVPPWRGVGQGDTGRAWEIGNSQVYRYTGSGPTMLEWDSGRFPILDTYPYNALTRPGRLYPVSDLAFAAGLEPAKEGLEAAVVLTARGHEFRARLTPNGNGYDGVLEMRPEEAGSQWRQLATVALAGVMNPGEVTNIEFWHVDQSLELYINGEQRAVATYDWTPAQRLKFALDADLELVQRDFGILEDRINYQSPSFHWEFDGGPFAMHRVSLARDIHYQANAYGPVNEHGVRHSKAGLPAAATHPTSTVNLTGDEFFCLGDNSPQSLDMRLMDVPNPWVAQIDPNMSVIHRSLLIGKAFFVYFPAVTWRYGIVPVPDAGRMRFIW